jgi:hypothetical protein
MGAEQHEMGGRGRGAARNLPTEIRRRAWFAADDERAAGGWFLTCFLGALVLTALAAVRGGPWVRENTVRAVLSTAAFASFLGALIQSARLTG